MSLEAHTVNGKHRLAALLGRVVNAAPSEITALLWSFCYFFCLLCSYYILRPVRDEMGIAGGVDQLQWVFTGTFLAMLVAAPVFGAAAARFPRRVLLPLVYTFFIANILAFYLLFQSGIGTTYVARAFFIWASVFNLFVVSVFWSFMTDIFTNAQGRRLFGFIAAGGSAGALTGPTVTAVLVNDVGPVNLLLVSAAVLGGAMVCISRLNRWASRNTPSDQGASPGSDESNENGGAALGGGMLDGVRLVLRTPYLLGICLFIWLFTTLSTFLYFQQANIVAAAFDDSAVRTQVFAVMDLGVNVLTIVTQVLLTGRIMSRFGVPKTLALLPVAVAGGFVCLALVPALPVLIGFQIVRRAGNFAITRPAREVLFTVVGREARYKAKNFIDTVVYRGGDAVSGWVFAWLKGMGLGLSAIAWIAVPIALLWIVTAVLLGRKQEALRSAP